MPQPDPDLPAILYRSRATWAEERVDAEMEEIGSGPLAVMVRLVMTDPDEEVWPYRIVAGGEAYEGRAILRLNQQMKDAGGSGTN